jgi:rubredoxin
MNPALIQCTLCGHTYNAEEHPSCQACPLAKGCAMTCCPVCGFQSVNVERSNLARIASRVFSINLRGKHASKEEEKN